MDERLEKVMGLADMAKLTALIKEYVQLYLYLEEALDLVPEKEKKETLTSYFAEEINYTLIFTTHEIRGFSVEK